MPRKLSQDEYLRLKAPLTTGPTTETEEDPEETRGLSSIPPAAPPPKTSLAPTPSSLQPPAPTPTVPTMPTVPEGPVPEDVRFALDPPEFKLGGKKKRGPAEGIRHAGYNALYSNEFRGQLQEFAGVPLGGPGAVDHVAITIAESLIANPEPTDDSPLWEPPETSRLVEPRPSIGAPGVPSLESRLTEGSLTQEDILAGRTSPDEPTDGPIRRGLHPVVFNALRYWGAAKMGKAYQSDEDLLNNFAADYAEHQKSQSIQVQDWDRQDKSDVRLGILPDGTLRSVDRSPDRDANIRMADHVDANADRTILLDSTEAEDHLLAMKAHTLGLTPEFVAGVLGSEADAEDIMDSPFAKVAPAAFEKGMPLVEILYSDGDVPAAAIQKQYQRLFLVKVAENLLDQGIDPRDRNHAEIAEAHGQDKLTEALTAGQRSAHEWWEKNVHQNDAPVVYFGNYDREKDLKELSESRSWKETIPGTDLSLPGAMWIVNYRESPAYQATYAQDRPAFAARYKDFPMEDASAARALELNWRKINAPGMGRALDVSIRSGSLTQQIGAAIQLAKEEADRKHAKGDDKAMRTDKIFLRAWELWNTPEHVERIVRVEDGTGYLMSELGNYVGGRALSGADQWYKVNPRLGGFGEAGVAAVPVAGTAASIPLTGIRGVLYAAGVGIEKAGDYLDIPLEEKLGTEKLKSINVLPRYVEDFGVGADGYGEGPDISKPLKFARWWGGVSDELPGWGLAVFLDAVDLGQPLNLLFIGPGLVKRGGASLLTAMTEKGAVAGPQSAREVWRKVLTEASPTDSVETLLSRAQEMDATLTGDVESLFTPMLLEYVGKGHALEGNINTHHRLLEVLSGLEKNLGDDIVGALDRGQRVLDTEKNIAELESFLEEATAHRDSLTAELKTQERLREMLDKSRLVTGEAEAPTATQKAVDKVRKEIDELVVEMDSLRSEGKDITAVQNKLRKKGEQFDEMNTALRAQELEAGAQVSKEAAEALSKEAEGVAVEGVDAAADVARLEGEIADLARQRDALKAKPAKEVVEEVVEEAAPPLRDPHQQGIHWDGPVPKGSTPEERIRPLMERLQAEKKKYGAYDSHSPDAWHLRAFPWKSVDGMAQLRKDLDELSKREPKGSKHQRGLRDAEGWIEAEHGRGLTPLPDTGPLVVEPVVAFVDDFFRKYPSPTKKAPKKAPKKTAKPDKALAGVEAKIVAAEKELVAARKAAEAAPKAAPAKEVAEAVVKEEPARVVLLDEIRAAVPEKAPDGRPIQFGDGPFSDINRAIYVSATQPSTKIGRTAIAWLESIGITRANQKVYRALMRKEVATAPKAFSSITVIGAKNLKGNIENFFLSRKGNRAAVKQRQRLKSFLAPPKKPKAPPKAAKAAKAKKEPPPPLALTAENLAQTMAKNPKLRAQVEKAAANRLKNRTKTNAYFKRVSAASKRLGVAIKAAAEKGTKKANAQVLRAQRELAKAIGNKEEFLVRMLSRQSDTIAKMQARLGITIAEARNGLRIAERAKEGVDPGLLKELLELGGKDFNGEPLNMAAKRAVSEINKDAAFLQVAVGMLRDPVTLAREGKAAAVRLMKPFHTAAERVLKVADSISEMRKDPDFINDLRAKIKTGRELDKAAAEGRVLDSLMILGRDDPEHLPSVARFVGMTDDEIDVALKAGLLGQEVASRWAIRDFLMRQWTEIAPRDVSKTLYVGRAMRDLYSRRSVSKPMWGAYVSRLVKGYFSKERPFWRSHRFALGMGEDLSLVIDRISRRARIQFSDLAKIRDMYTPYVKGVKAGGSIQETDLYFSVVRYISSTNEYVLKSLGKKIADRLKIKGDSARAFFGRDTRLLGHIQQGGSIIDDALEAFHLGATAAERAGYESVPTDIQGVSLFINSLLRFSGSEKAVSDMTKKTMGAFFKVLNNEMGLWDEVISTVGTRGEDVKYRQLVEAVRLAWILASKGEAWKSKFVSPLSRNDPGDLNFAALRDSIEVLARTSLELDAIKQTYNVAGGMHTRSNQQALAAYYGGPDALSEFFKHRDFVANDVVVLAEDAVKLENLTKETVDSLTEASSGGLNPLLDKGFARSFFIDSIDNEAQTVILINTSNPKEIITTGLKDIAYRPPAFTFLDFYDSSIAYGISFAPSLRTTARRAGDPRFMGLGAANEGAKLKLLEYITLHIGPNGTTRPVLKVVRDEALESVTGRGRMLAGQLKERMEGKTPSVADDFLFSILRTANDYWKLGVLYGWTALSIRPDRPMEIFIDDTLNTFVSPGAGERANLVESLISTGQIGLGGTLAQVPVIGDGLARIAQFKSKNMAQTKGKVSLPPPSGVYVDAPLDRILSAEEGLVLRAAEGKISVKQIIKEMVEDGIDDNIRSEDGINSMVRMLGRDPEGFESAWTRPSFREDISTSTSFILDEHVPTGVAGRTFNGVKTVIKRTVGPNNVTTRWMDGHIRNVTMRQRAQLYLHLRTAKKVPRDAARRIVLEALYDWDLVATHGIETKILKRLFPWYTWQKNLMMQMGSTLMESGTMPVSEAAGRWITGRTRAQRLALAYRLRKQTQYETLALDEDMDEQELLAARFEMELPYYYDKHGILGAYSIDYEGRERGAYEQKNWGVSPPLMGLLEGYEAYAEIGLHLALTASIAMSGAIRLVSGAAEQVPTYELQESTVAEQLDAVVKIMIDQMMPQGSRFVESMLGIAPPNWGLEGAEVRLNKKAYLALAGFPFQQDGHMRKVEKEGQAPFYVWKPPRWMDSDLARGFGLDIASFIAGNTKEQYSRNLEATGLRKKLGDVPGIGYLLGMEREPAMKAILESIEAAGGDVQAYMLAIAQLGGILNALSWDGEASLNIETDRKLRKASQEATALEAQQDARAERRFGEEPRDVPSARETLRRLHRLREEG